MKFSILLQIVAIILALIGVLANFRSRRGIIKTSSQLNPIDGKPVAVIKAFKEGQKRLVIQSIRFSIHTFDHSPKLVDSGVSKIINVIDDVISPDYHFVSDDVIQYLSQNKTMEEGDELYANIDLDAMMESYINLGETMYNKFIFLLVISTLKVEVRCTNGKLFKKYAHRDIKKYLKNKYLNDERLYKK